MGDSGREASYSLNFNVGAVRDHLSGIFQDYKGWIGRNPGSASDVESFFKILAYLLPGKIRGNSTVIPELLYSTANVISFWHDHILREEEKLIREQKLRAERPTDYRNGSAPTPGTSTCNNNYELEEDPESTSRNNRIFKLQVALTILEYFEVFVEVAARKLWGDGGRWMIIFVMQTIKATFRAVLVFYYKTGLMRSPVIPSFDRSKYKLNKGSNVEDNPVFVLQHSGRAIRKLQATPPMQYRDWCVPELPLSYSTIRELPRDRLIAEIIHISRPLFHLLSLGACGTTSFKPWALSLLMDVSSLYLHGDPFKCNKRDQLEMRRRTFSLLLYLFRSPFYDLATKQRLISSLEAIGSRVPIIGNIFRLLAQAIPQWQSTYSYVWS